MGMAVQDHLGGKALLFQQGLCLVHRALLNIEGQYPAPFPRQAAQQRRVPAPACCGVNAERTFFHMATQKFMDYSQRVQLHLFYSFSGFF